jgi:hypothetical protein
MAALVNYLRKSSEKKNITCRSSNESELIALLATFFCLKKKKHVFKCARSSATHTLNVVELKTEKKLMALYAY